MAYREVRVIEIKEVLRLWLAAVPKKRIAEMTHLDRRTVRRHITLATSHGLVPGDRTKARRTAICHVMLPYGENAHRGCVAAVGW